MRRGMRPELHLRRLPYFARWCTRVRRICDGTSKTSPGLLPTHESLGAPVRACASGDCPKRTKLAARYDSVPRESASECPLMYMGSSLAISLSSLLSKASACPTAGLGAGVVHLSCFQQKANPPCRGPKCRASSDSPFLARD